jgi:hypothetical protein
LLLKRVLDRIGIEANLTKLVREHLHIVWMGMTNTNDSMTAIEVKELLSFIVPDGAALRLDRSDIKE